jgi:hypothetical protein
MKQFIQSCPANELCPLLDQTYSECLKTRKEPVCSTYVFVFSRLMPVYDCQRWVDHTPEKDYLVPAIYLCEQVRIWNYMELLSVLQFKEAQLLFSSPEFRSILSGEYGEGFRDLSEQREKSLKNLKDN